jgi:predicted nucleic-acid-binding Zn-ribbon protein
MQEAKKCPRCRSRMERGSSLGTYGGITMLKKGDLVGDKIIPFYCNNCGYVELYNEKFLATS